jgi:glyceraldehyde-3-phosphate dehydrogenase (NADP+)
MQAKAGGAPVTRLAWPNLSAVEELMSGIPLEHRTYLRDGEILIWPGPVEDVLSPVCVEDRGALRPLRLGTHPRLDGAEALKALDAAVAAYDRGRGLWPTMSVADRIAHVEAFLAAMRRQRDLVIRLIMLEIGKTLKDSTTEFDRTVKYVEDTITALKELDRTASRFVLEQGFIAQIRRAPLGVTLVMGPFNYPLNETFTTLIPALIMGNPVVFKTPKLGTLLYEPLLEAFRDAFPPGVVNVISGRGSDIIGPVMASGKVDVLAFIGSSKVANELQRRHPRPARLRSILGLDAKNPAIVLADADLDVAVQECVTGALSFNGQRCTAIKLIFVQRTIADAFVAALGDAISNLRGGMPWEDGVALTPLPEPGKPAFLAGYVEDATNRDRPARVVNPGGGEVDATWFMPALLYPVSPDMRIFHEEQFGPVVPVVPFDAVDEPLAHIVASNYGLQASLFGRDAAVIGELIDLLANQVGRINVNAQCQRGPDTFPYTGRKDSAEGTLSVTDALRVFSIRAVAATKNERANRDLLSDVVHRRASRFLSTDFIF